MFTPFTAHLHSLNFHLPTLDHHGVLNLKNLSDFSYSAPRGTFPKLVSTWHISIPFLLSAFSDCPKIGFHNSFIRRFFTPQSPLSTSTNNSNYTMNRCDTSGRACGLGSSEGVGRGAWQRPEMRWGLCFGQGQGSFVRALQRACPSAARTVHRRCPQLL